MGIQGLLPLLKPVIRDNHISNFEGRRIAVDTYAWLHKAAYSCAADLCNGVENKKWIQLCLRLIDMLLEFNIEIYLVFDGNELPAKQATEVERMANRQINLTKAREYSRSGDGEKAFKCYTQAVDINPRMAAELINVVRKHRPMVKYVVSPYEADAQLSFLCSANLVDGVISEDSDTIPYGCTEMIFKLQNDGSCNTLKLADMYNTAITGFDMRNFTPDMTICMCIAAGCDYLNSCKGVGIKKAYEIVSRQKEPQRILRKMRLENLIPLVFIPQLPSSSSTDTSNKNVLQYDIDFYKALFTFHHQTVFDIRKRCTLPLNPITSIPLCFTALNLSVTFVGPDIDATLACAIADGFVDPVTLTAFNIPEELHRPLSSIPSAKKLQTTTGQKPLMNNFFIPVEKKKLAPRNSAAEHKVSVSPHNQSTLQQQHHHHQPSIPHKTSEFFKSSSSAGDHALCKRLPLKSADLMMNLKLIQKQRSRQFWEDTGLISQGEEVGNENEEPLTIGESNEFDIDTDVGYYNDLEAPVDKSQFNISMFALPQANQSIIHEPQSAPKTSCAESSIDVLNRMDGNMIILDSCSEDEIVKDSENFIYAGKRDAALTIDAKDTSSMKRMRSCEEMFQGKQPFSFEAFKFSGRF